jgi:3-isopropylmalate/(R)-2-methylmalate dehydratase small subunit
MNVTGRIWKFGDHIDTDVIIPARYLVTTDPATLAAHCMEDADPEFVRKIRPGDIIVAGENFGCGSSREHAPIAIKGAAIACVIAKSYARIFYRNAFNMGLPIFESPDLWDQVADGDTVAVDSRTGVITVAKTGATLTCQPIPPFMEELIRDGGLISHLAKKAGRTVPGGAA